MTVEVEINGTVDESARYVATSPSQCRIRLAAPTAANSSVVVTLRSRPAQQDGGEVVFYASQNQTSTETQAITLSADGAWANFQMGAKIDFVNGSPRVRASVNDKDCLLVVSGLEEEVVVPLMVRIRKNANDLTDNERDRFLEALYQLNRSGTGIYQDFIDVHGISDTPDRSTSQAHGGPQFLPWHRAYLLDLERELQIIDPSVSLPYWRFDQPAPRIFQADFMGETAIVPEPSPSSPGPSPTSLAVFSNTNPLAAWATTSGPGILRSAFFNPATSPAPGLLAFDFPLLSQVETLALGDIYGEFVDMESSPHGAAHVSFSGSISEIPTAVRDPLFFLLHANIDRLWALWQWLNQRTAPQQLEVYTPQNIDGRRLDDTMWPWNEVVTPPRPEMAPGGPLSGSSTTLFPGETPRVQDVIDFQGHEISSAKLSYGYDDIPYEFS